MGHAVISDIRIEVSNVFDLRKPEENNFVGRAANFIHIRTRPQVVRNALLFKAGDPVDARVIHESERILRALSFIRDARIVPEVGTGGRVTAVVEVRDAWSIKGGLKLHHVGGQTAYRFRVDEVNFLGYGKEILVSHEKDYERTTDELAYTDPQLFGSRWTLRTNYKKLSDGKARLLALERPFYALEARWSAGVWATRYQYVETLYNNGHSVYAFPSIRDEVSLFASWQYAGEGRTVRRAGIEFLSRQNLYGRLFTYRDGLLPAPDLADRRFRGLFFNWELAQDRYRTYDNLEAIGRTEDYNLGWDATLKLGYFSRSFGSTADAPYTQFEVTKGFAPGDDVLMLWRTVGHGRHENGLFRDIYLRSTFTWYSQHFRRQTLAFNADVAVGNRLDPEDYLYLGGSDGWRGYPNHFKAGDRRWRMSFEDRLVTSRSLWGLLQVGYVAYVDVGGLRSLRTGAMGKTYADVGAGFRFGNMKSAFGRVILLTVAVPLVKGPGVDNYQIVVGNVVDF